MTFGLWFPNEQDHERQGKDGGRFLEVSPLAAKYLIPPEPHIRKPKENDSDWDICPNCGAIGSLNHIAKCEKPLTEAEKIKIRIVPMIIFLVMVITALYGSYKYIVFIFGG